jgi:hypothetical protein
MNFFKNRLSETLFLLVILWSENVFAAKEGIVYEMDARLVVKESRIFK